MRGVCDGCVLVVCVRGVCDGCVRTQESRVCQGCNHAWARPGAKLKGSVELLHRKTIQEYTTSNIKYIKLKKKKVALQMKKSKSQYVVVF